MLDSANNQSMTVWCLLLASFKRAVQVLGNINNCSIVRWNKTGQKQDEKPEEGHLCKWQKSLNWLFRFHVWLKQNESLLFFSHRGGLEFGSTDQDDPRFLWHTVLVILSPSPHDPKWLLDFNPSHLHPNQQEKERQKGNSFLWRTILWRSTVFQAYHI